MKMETLQQRRDELERKEQQLKESLLKFDKFLKVRFDWLPNQSLLALALAQRLAQLLLLHRKMI